MEDEVKLRLLPLTHSIPECNGDIVPKFHFLTSQGRIRVTGYCIQCAAELFLEFDLTELEKACPADDEETPAPFEQVMDQPEQQDTLKTFEPPPGSKAN
jgi:hypothetical protein